MNIIARNIFSYGKYINLKDVVKGIEKVTVEQIKNLSNKIFSPSSCTITSLVDKETFKINKLDDPKKFDFRKMI